MAESRDDIDMVCRGPSWKSTWARPPLSADDIITGGREPQASPWPPLVEYQSYPMTDRLAVTPITRANRVREAIGDFLRRLRPGPRPAQVMLFGVGDSRFNPCVSLAGWHTNQRPEATPAQSSGQYAPLLRLLSEVRLESRAMRSPQSFETTLDVPQGVRVQLTLVDIGPTILAAAVQDASLAARLRPDDAVEVTGIAQDIRFLPLPPRSVDAIIATWTIEYAMKGIARDYSWPATAKEKAQLARKLLDALRPGAPGLAQSSRQAPRCPRDIRTCSGSI
jgi:hypothetical protein